MVTYVVVGGAGVVCIFITGVMILSPEDPIGHSSSSSPRQPDPFPENIISSVAPSCLGVV
jgi:hypothetical protein